jgi:hypothetical protein
MFQLELDAETVNETELPTLVLDDVGLIVRVARALAGNTTARRESGLISQAAPGIRKATQPRGEIGAAMMRDFSGTEVFGVL